MELHSDFIDFIGLMVKHEVEFVIVGAHALGFYGLPRATGVFDFWNRTTEENAEKILTVINDYFGTTMGLNIKDILDEETIQFGVQPVRVDLIKNLTGISNEDLWDTRVAGNFADFNLYFINRDLFIKNKKATGRHKDLADANILLDYEKNNK